MCIALPAKIVARSANSDLACADVGGTMRDVNIGLISGEGIECGDWVLIHSGFAISKIDEEEARTTFAFLKTLMAGERGEN